MSKTRTSLLTSVVTALALSMTVQAAPRSRTTIDTNVFQRTGWTEKEACDKGKEAARTLYTRRTSEFEQKFIKVEVEASGKNGTLTGEIAYWCNVKVTYETRWY